MGDTAAAGVDVSRATAGLKPCDAIAFAGDMYLLLEGLRATDRTLYLVYEK